MLSVVSVVSAVEEVEALVVVETVPGVGSFPQEERTAADAQSAPTIRQSEIIFFIVNSSSEYLVRNHFYFIK